MCLDRITKRAEDMPAAAIGYKVVGNANGKCWPFVFDRVKEIPLERGFGWAMPDQHYLIYTEREDEEYAPGVHAWATRRRGYAECEVKVLLRGPICEGIQGVCKVIVYREMTILEILK